MQRSSRSRTTVGRSKSLQEQLNTYALAASAAGVSLMALAQPAESKPNRQIGPATRLTQRHRREAKDVPPFHSLTPPRVRRLVVVFAEHRLKLARCITRFVPYRFPRRG